MPQGVKTPRLRLLIIQKSAVEKTDLLSIIHKQAVPGLAAWNLENYTNLIHSKINREKEVKPNHLSSLLEEYGDLLSDKAKHYLNIDFSLDTESSEKNTKLDEIIKNRKFQRL